MSDDAQWVIGIGLLIILPLIGVVWMFLRKEIADARMAIAQSESRFEQWKRDKEKFDYEFRHSEYAPAISRIHAELWPMGKQVESLEKRVGELKDWKHVIADAYLPRAVDEHERRINRLDAKVFNGHK